ncbi:MAG: helix-turn-helix transcriptional regulator, partial [Ktedonobacterales bacterium]
MALIIAPAGYGKTTLLTDWIIQRQHDVAWVSLDAADNDIVRFCTYVFTALAHIEREASARAMAILHVPRVPPIQVILSAFVGMVMTMTEDMILVLDDYHVITSEAVHESLAFLIEHLPPRLHIVIASRTDPPFGIS